MTYLFDCSRQYGVFILEATLLVMNPCNYWELEILPWSPRRINSYMFA